MANVQNLTKMGKARGLTTEEAQKMGRKGGKKSAEVRKARKTFSEDLLNALSDGKTQEQILNALLNQCKQGNVRAFEILRDTVGEKPIDRQEVKEVTSEWFK